MAGQNLETEKYNIICLSNQLWDFPNWTNKRLVMDRMARLGHNVLFVDPQLNFGRVFFRQMKRGLWDLKRILTQKKVDDSGVLVYTPINLLPFTSITSKLHIKRIRSLANSYLGLDSALGENSDKKTLLWVYHVQMSHLADYVENLDYDILVYDCVDNYLGFPEESAFYSTIVPKNKVEEQEKELTERADVVFATAPGLVDKLKVHNQNVHFAPNVGDYDRYKDVPKLKKSKDQIPEELKAIPRPRIGYVGALDEYKFDYALLKKAAEDHPSYSFVVIGPMALKDREASMKELGFEGFENVYFLGSIPWEQKKYYYAGFDVDTIPYILNEYTVGGCFPVKFHDSLAAGLPIVVTDLPAYLPFEDVCYISKNADEYSANIKKALDEDSVEKVRVRQLVAKENDWDGKVDRMLEIVLDL